MPVSADRERVKSVHAFAHKCLMDVIEDYPEDKALYQSAPTDNHLLWTLGHLAVTNGWVLSLIEALPPDALPEAYWKQFGYQSEVVASADAYPPYAEVRDAYDRLHDLFMSAMNDSGDDVYTRSLEEKSHGFAKDFGDAALRMAWHEGWHAGQLSSLRRAIGLGPAFKGEG